MVHRLLRRVVRILQQPAGDRYVRSDTEIAEVIDALERRLSELHRAVKAEAQG